LPLRALLTRPQCRVCHHHQHARAHTRRSACNALILLLLGVIPSTAAVAVVVSGASKDTDRAHAVAAPVASKDVEMGATHSPEAETVVVA
jgi:hypothetical protein